MNKSFLKLILVSASIAGPTASIVNAAIFVRVAPPRPVVERVVPRPGPTYVWTAGYYRWTGHAYMWTPGQWVLPPRVGAIWVPPHWSYVPARRSYVFVAGFWR